MTGNMTVKSAFTNLIQHSIENPRHGNYTRTNEMHEPKTKEYNWQYLQETWYITQKTLKNWAKKLLGLGSEFGSVA